MSAPCGSDIPSILEAQLKKSVEMTRRDLDAQILGIGTGRPVSPLPVQEPDEDYEGEALKRLKELVAETRKLADRAEALVASMRSPANYHRNT